MPDQPAPAADDAFGADLYRLLSEQAPNAVFSPVSVASVLQMALCGARGQTAAELAGALHLDGAPDTAAARRPTCRAPAPWRGPRIPRRGPGAPCRRGSPT